MGIFTTSDVIIGRPQCGSALGGARYRPFPARLDVTEIDGAPANNERAGRVLQRLDEGFLELSPWRQDELRPWLAANAVELVYRLRCPQDGLVWIASPDIAAATRRNRGESRWIKPPVH